MVLSWILLGLLWSAEAAEIELIQCEPPDMPLWGGYGPHLKEYLPGDSIHYYCDVDTFIGGNYYRRCEDTGYWSGDTPVCDAPVTFRTTIQTSDFANDSTADLATDGLRTTCSETIGEVGEVWAGNFTEPGQLIRVMMFLAKGPVAYQVILVKPNGAEVVCDSHTEEIDRYDWIYHNCPEPDNVDAVGLKIRSLSDDALKICEIAVYVLTTPICPDPRAQIKNGRLRLSRKSAVLICDSGYTRSKSAKLECIREGQWNRRNLQCTERSRNIEDRESWYNREDSNNEYEEDSDSYEY